MNEQDTEGETATLHKVYGPFMTELNRFRSSATALHYQGLARAALIDAETGG